MKKIMYFALAAFLMAACSKDDTPIQSQDNSEPGVTIKISAVDGLTLTKGLTSHETIQQIASVKLYAFKKADSLFVASKDVTWTLGQTATSEVTLPLPLGDYIFLAVGLGNETLNPFNVTVPIAGTTKLSAMKALIASSGYARDIFSGIKVINVSASSTCIPLPITRGISGLLVYVQNVPKIFGGKNITYLRLKTSKSNYGINLINQTGTNPSISYTVAEIRVADQVGGTTFYTGNVIEGVTKLPNSQLMGEFITPIDGSVLTLELYDNNEALVKKWTILDAGGVSPFNLTAGNLYTLGRKVQKHCTNAGTPTPIDDDLAIDLSQYFSMDQCLGVTISPNWSIIPGLKVQ